MQDKPIPQDPAAAHDVAARDVLYLLTTPEDGQPLWSVEDLAREAEAHDVMPYVRSLQGAGLVNRTSDGFVFATRAGVRVVQMVGHVI